MDSRRNSRNIAPTYDEHIRQESRMMRRDPLPNTHHPTEPLPHPELLEDKLASQAIELEQLARDNRKLATGHLALRQDLAAANGEVDKLREHMRSIQTEGDIQIRILLDKIEKSEVGIRAGDNLKRELQEAHIEARSVMAAKLELSSKIEQTTKKLEYSHANIRKLPEMRAKLDSLKQDYQRLRKTFEHEKGLNVERVEQMKILENDLIGIAGEVERLRTEVSNAEKRDSVPITYGDPNMAPRNLHRPPFHGNGSGYRPHLHTVHGAPMQIVNSYASGGFAVGPQVISGSVGGANGGFVVGPQVMSGAIGGTGGAWGGVHDASHARV